MNGIYLKIIERIKANEQLFIDCGLAPFKHFDKYKQQDVDPELHQPYEPPALFYQFQADWNDAYQAGVQKGNFTIRLHIVLETYGESYDGSPDQTHTLKIDKYQEVVHAIVHGLHGEHFGRLLRTNTDPNTGPGYLYWYVLTYKCSGVDNSAARYRPLVDVVGDDVAVEKVDNKPGAQAADEFLL